jgi:hypothetical protein
MMAGEPELVCVRKCQGLDLAQIYKSKLEAMGVPVLLRYEAAGVIFGITIDGLGEVRVMVPAQFAAEAEALLRDEETAAFDEGEAEASDVANQDERDPSIRTE